MDQSKLPPSCVEIEHILLNTLETYPKLSILSLVLDESMFYQEKNRERIVNLRKQHIYTVCVCDPSADLIKSVKEIYETAIQRRVLNRLMEMFNKML